MQVVARWVLVAVVVGAAVGLAGHGPLSWTTAQAGDGRLRVDYERFGRAGGSQAVRVEVDGELAVDGVWSVVLTGALAGVHELSTITPEPVSMRAVDDGVELRFDQSGDADLAVTFELAPGGLWRESSGVSVPGAGEVAFTQIIYP